MSSTFEGTFVDMVSTALNNSNVTLAWAKLPLGAPVLGKIDVVFFYAPGGERTLTHGGMAKGQRRNVQVSLFSPDPQDVKDVAKALHVILDGYHGSLDDGSSIDAILPGQDVDLGFDNEEKVHQTVFDLAIWMSET